MAEKFKILVADKLAPEGLKFIEDQPDCELVNKPGLSDAEYTTLMGECDAMLVRSGIKVTPPMMANPGKMKVIARAGVGVDNIDLKAATDKGILVLNSAEASTISTAEHAFTLMMALCRNVGLAHQIVAKGGWDRNKLNGITLEGKTLAIVGFGRIGQTIAHRAMAFGMTVIAYDPFINAKTMMDGKVQMFSDFKELLPHADIITFHVPKTEQTTGMLNKDTWKLCKKGVRVVNAARGGIVDETDLLEALESGQCDGIALDVFTKEPPAEDSPLRNHPKILTTPHLGASTVEGQKAVSIIAIENALAYLRGQGVLGAVNAGGYRVDLTDHQKFYVDLADRMASLLAPICTRGIAKVNIEINGGELKAAAGTIERVVLMALLKTSTETPVNVINVKTIAQGRGMEVTTTLCDEKTRGERLTINVEGPEGSVTKDTHPADRSRHIMGRVFEDNRPRVLEINGYYMDMVPAGNMMLIRNADRPGMIGLVGNTLGEAGVNIADMAISRRDTTALMVLKVDDVPSVEQIAKLKANEGILHVSSVQLPAEKA
jgi:D-3-phosphoglycerate dehydrogenase